MRGLVECIGALDGDSGGDEDREYRMDFHSQPQVTQELMQSSVEEFREEPEDQISMNGISWVDRDWFFDVGREGHMTPSSTLSFQHSSEMTYEQSA